MTLFPSGHVRLEHDLELRPRDDLFLRGAVVPSPPALSGVPLGSQPRSKVSFALWPTKYLFTPSVTSWKLSSPLRSSSRWMIE